MAAELKKCEIELKSIKQGKELIEKETEELKIELETERKSIKSMCEFCTRSEGTTLLKIIDMHICPPMDKP